MIKQPAIYLDMDDVVADWLSEAQKFLNQKLDGSFMLPDHQYNRLASEHERFYRNLGLLPGAQELVDWARNYSKRTNKKLLFLTALPHDGSVPFAAYDKTLWAQERFPDIPVHFGPYSYDKHRHCKPGDILIDDRHENCMDWRRAGGISHIYVDWENCKKWIRETLKDNI